MKYKNSTTGNQEEEEVKLKDEELDEKERSKDCLISTTLGELLNRQKSHEMQNYTIYKEFSNYYKRNGLRKLSKYYLLRSEEEKLHHDWIMDRLLECNCELVYNINTDNPYTWKNLLEPFDLTMEIEFKTTKMIYEIVDAAYKEKDYKLVSWLLKKLVDEQHEEEAVSLKAKQIANINADWLMKEDEILKLLTR